MPGPFTTVNAFSIAISFLVLMNRWFPLDTKVFNPGSGADSTVLFALAERLYWWGFFAGYVGARFWRHLASTSFPASRRPPHTDRHGTGGLPSFATGLGANGPVFTPWPRYPSQLSLRRQSLVGGAFTT